MNSFVSGILARSLVVVGCVSAIVACSGGHNEQDEQEGATAAADTVVQCPAGRPVLGVSAKGLCSWPTLSTVTVVPATAVCSATEDATVRCYYRPSCTFTGLAGSWQYPGVDQCPSNTSLELYSCAALQTVPGDATVIDFHNAGCHPGGAVPGGFSCPAPATLSNSQQATIQNGCPRSTSSSGETVTCCGAPTMASTGR
jgi:hypothetical protein